MKIEPSRQGGYHSHLVQQVHGVEDALQIHHNVGGTNNNDNNIVLVVITSVGRVSGLQV